MDLSVYLTSILLAIMGHAWHCYCLARMCRSWTARGSQLRQKVSSANVFSDMLSILLLDWSLLLKLQVRQDGDCRIHRSVMIVLSDFPTLVSHHVVEHPPNKEDERNHVGRTLPNLHRSRRGHPHSRTDECQLACRHIPFLEKSKMRIVKHAK